MIEIPRKQSYVDTWEEPTQLFAKAMEREMIGNSHKGCGMPKMSLSKLNSELQLHVAKLQEAAVAIDKDVNAGQKPSDWLRSRILEFSADVGNCAMFFAHNYGVLTPQQLKHRTDENDMMENPYELIPPIPLPPEPEVKVAPAIERRGF